MKSLIKLQFLFFSLLIFTASLNAEVDKVKKNLTIISVYQIEDETDAAFDFFTSQRTHKCGGKLSNRHRSYSDDRKVADRKFQLVLAAFNHQHKVTIKALECEGKAMLVDYIGISQ